MSRYLAERPTVAESDARFFDTAAMYFHVLRDGYGGDYAAERTAVLIEDKLTERATGYTKDGIRFGTRELRRHWEEVAVTYTDAAVSIAALMASGNMDDARCALAATLDAIEPS
jgi:hypothetical protein